MKKTFSYMGHTFEGIRLFTEREDFRTITKNMYDSIFQRSYPWSYDRFYQEANKHSTEKFDVFLMDNTFEVVPSQCGLFIYGTDFYHKWGDKIFHESAVKRIKDSLEGFRNEMEVFILYLIDRKKEIEVPDDKFIPITFHTDEGVKTITIRKVYFLDRNNIVFEDETGIKVSKTLETSKTVLTEIVTIYVDEYSYEKLKVANSI